MEENSLLWCVTGRELTNFFEQILKYSIYFQLVVIQRQLICTFENISRSLCARTNHLISKILFLFVDQNLMRTWYGARKPIQIFLGLKKKKEGEEEGKNQ